MGLPKFSRYPIKGLSLQPDLPISLLTQGKGAQRATCVLSPWDDSSRIPHHLCKGSNMIGRILLLLSGVGLLISGCVVRPAYVEVTPPAVVVPAVTVESPPPARHCPPGHAKKGWC